MTYHISDDPDSSECGSRRQSHSFGQRRHRSRHGERKERVLHTRVSEQLSEDIRRFAEDLRIPVSNLVRNVLEEVFTVVDGVTSDVGVLFDDLLEEAEGVRDRVRHQTRPWRGTRRRSRRRGARSDHDVDSNLETEIEHELREDEAVESGPRSQAPGHLPASDDDSTTESEPSHEQPAATELFPDVLGWQPLVLNRDFECGRCKRSLIAGESAFLGLAAAGLTEIALCGRCAGRC